MSASPARTTSSASTPRNGNGNCAAYCRVTARSPVCHGLEEPSSKLDFSNRVPGPQLQNHRACPAVSYRNYYRISRRYEFAPAAAPVLVRQEGAGAYGADQGFHSGCVPCILGSIHRPGGAVSPFPAQMEDHWSLEAGCLGRRDRDQPQKTRHQVTKTRKL